jgi:hypothetical protein
VKQYRWHKIDGVVDAETGRQVLQLDSLNCSGKFRALAGKMLVEELNTYEIRKTREARMLADLLVDPTMRVIVKEKS